MKQQRFRFKIIALVLFGLFALLAVYGGSSVLTNGSRWFASAHNPRLQAQKKQVAAGDILDRGGALLASTDAEGQRVYASAADTRTAMVHVVGDAQGYVRNGVESFQASYLYGFQTSVFERIGELLNGVTRKGDTVQLTVSAPLSEALAASMKRTGGPDVRGAAVVLNYKTGEVLSAVSLPAFDPANAETAPSGEQRLNRAFAVCYEPGAAFETLTAAAAMQSDPALLNRTFDCGAADAHGAVTLHDAYRAGCDEAFGQAGPILGDGAIRGTAEAFAYNDNVLFRDLVIENAVFPAGDGDAARHAVGLDGIRATPMHLCMMAAGIANGGVIMEPRLLLCVISGNSSERLSFSASVYRTALSGETARQLRQWMADASALPGAAGRAVRSGENAVYTGYLRDDALPYAVCVVLEDAEAKQALSVARDAAEWLTEHMAPADAPAEGDGGPIL